MRHLKCLSDQGIVMICGDTVDGRTPAPVDMDIS